MKLLNLFTAKNLENKAVVGNDTCLKKNGNESLSATSGNVYNSGTRAKKLQAQAFENAENGADKVLFKSEKNSSVHKKYMNFSSARKRALDAPLYAFSGGRSMVEMLGVLAIIGVLSVGAISGYNTAMYKYRMNKTIEAFSELFANMIALSPKMRPREAFNGRQGILAYQLLSKEQCPESSRDSSYCKLPLGEVSTGLRRGTEWYPSDDGTLHGHLYIYFNEGDIVKSCVDFLSYGWQNMYPPEWLLDTGYVLDGSYISVGTGMADKRYLWHNFIAKKNNITLSDIQTVCDVCKKNSECFIQMLINML